MARKKALRQLHALLTRELGDVRSPSIGDPVPLPLVDGLDAAISFRPFTPKGLCNGCPAAKLVDQRRMFVLHGPSSIRKFFGTQYGKLAKASFEEEPQTFRHDQEMAWAGETPDYKRECGARLRRAREAAGYSTLKAFAADTQIDQDNLSNWERGVSQIPASYVSLLKRLFGIDHGWIFDEDASGLPDRLRRELLRKDARRA